MARQRQQAVAFLECVLGSGPLPSQQAWEQAWQAGYSRRTYDRARKVLKVQARRRGWGSMGQWELCLPPTKRQRFTANVTQMENALTQTSNPHQSHIRA